MDDSHRPPGVRPRRPTQTWERRVALDLRWRFAPDHVVRTGQNIGKYVLGEPIARGGMAEVWGARVEGPQGAGGALETRDAPPVERGAGAKGG